ncbi:hypothetical protein P171DRAFT_431313 [Karstenula rhodostoma CBS 690.94]|uniref:Ankyrin n=1 Tax=Karstenula rhodostoma CBS 690.94 TaxID=1392251 RepID=A0A9P4UBT0_9PLEO|nr:hypothetical protein P171DRAFT_431313 [Karstenula rhodostoma CBS 690.94]
MRQAINAADLFGCTPLQYALRDGYQEVCQILLDASVIPSPQDFTRIRRLLGWVTQGAGSVEERRDGASSRESHVEDNREAPVGARWEGEFGLNDTIRDHRNKTALTLQNHIRHNMI